MKDKFLLAPRKTFHICDVSSTEGGFAIEGKALRHDSTDRRYPPPRIETVLSISCVHDMIAQVQPTVLREEAEGS